MKIVIIEDEKAAVRNLTSLLNEIKPNGEIVTILDSISSTIEWFSSYPMSELVFMDIHLADGSAFEIFNHINITCPIIFTTAYDEYAIQAFKFNSFDYLLKPVNTDELAAALQKVNRYSSARQGGSDDIHLLLEQMRKNNYRYRERFLLPYRDGYVSVSVNDISHVALDGRNVCLYMKNGTNEKISYSLDELEKQLNPNEFFRVNRQYIVRIDSILSINNWFNSRLKVHLKKYPETEVVVSRERATALKEWLDR